MLMEHQLSALHGSLGALLRPDLHRLRPVRAAGDLGTGDDAAAAAARQPEALTVALLELDGVTRRYGALVALDQVAMRVEEGEVRAVIGPNGAGKTTLFNVITGTVKPSAGLIRFADQPIAGLPSHQICRLGISRTFQITALFPEMSARENARLAAQARHPRRWQPFGGGTDLRRGPSARRCGARAARPRRHRRPACRTALARRSAPARGRHGHGAAAARAAARRADAGALGRGDGTGGRHAGALPAGLADDGPSGRARHGGGVSPRPQDHGAASRRGDRRRRAGPGEGRSARAGRLSRRLSTDAADRGHEHALRRQPRPAGRRPRHAAGPHQRRARPQRRRQDDDGEDHHGAGRPERRARACRQHRHHRLAAAPRGARGRGLRARGTADLSRSHRDREHPGRRTRARHAPGRSSGCSTCSPRCASAPPAGARSSRAANSRCWRSPARWCPIPR